ncbi:MAG: hypothetical protein QF473_33570 [Planctomycetota bacterium]|jgi:peptide subunit release factor 1 (eRF1)|nr:hypothetical protein [Planctomycetota bacterium]
MELKNLKKHVHTLATLDETSAPVISCYLNLEKGEKGYREALNDRVRLVRETLKENRRGDFESALGRVEEFIGAALLPDAKGTALFARAGDEPFFLPLQFEVPLPNSLAVDSTPNIFHLVELKDTYHRYVVMLCGEDRARILEINLGSVTEQLWAERPELRKRVGREWTKEHYQNHRRERTKAFVKEKIQLLNELMSASGHSHLILAGNRKITSQIEKALPRHLAEKRISTLEASTRDEISEVVAKTLSTFIEEEERESLQVVSRLEREVHTDGLAVVGTSPCLESLKIGQADVLILARDYEPKPAWKCSACTTTHVSKRAPQACPECGEKKVHEIDTREELVRLAEQSARHVEIVNDSDVLMQLGGVGCLVRYRITDRHRRELAELTGQQGG